MGFLSKAIKRIISLIPSSATGVVTSNTTQTITGAKTFTSAVTADVTASGEKGFSTDGWYNCTGFIGFTFSDTTAISLSGDALRVANAVFWQSIELYANNTKRVGITASTGLELERTITAGGTTGVQTINKMAGRINIAAAEASKAVTNSLVTTSSLIFCTIATNDATATIKNVVAGAGTFTITLTAAATAETAVNFWVTN